MKIKIICIILLNLSIILSGMTSLSAQEPVQAPQNTDQLTEPHEVGANKIQPPEVVMDILGIRPGLTIGEVGAGKGRVTVHLASRIGETGKLYASDIDPDAIDYLEARCLRLGLNNVEALHGLPDDPLFPVNSLDLVFMSWVYHHIDDPVPLLRNLPPALKPWGLVVLVEPKPSYTEENARVLTKSKVSEEAEAAGFVLAGVLEDRLEEDNIFILSPAVPDEPASHDPEKIRALWLEYIEWTKIAGGQLSLRGYAGFLDEQGIPGPEVRRRLHVIRTQYTEQPEGIEFIYDPLYGKPLTGDLEKDGFRTSPNAFMVESVKDIKPAGKALDVGCGMGRNAVYLAGLGWDVTGIDLSGKGLEVLLENAEKAGLNVTTIKSSYEDFDFGHEQWDMIAMILSWAPVEDPGFLSRLKASVRPGGYVIFEHVIQRSEDPFPPGVHALDEGALRELFGDFEILDYRETDLYGDWGGPPTPHVQMLARKRN